MSIRIRININKVSRLSEYVREVIDLAIRTAALRIKAELQDITPSDTGGLRGSFRAVPTREGIELRWGTSYASYPDAGTPPHTILPKNKKALSFGGKVYKRVEHPGQIPQNYTTLTLIEARRILQEEISKAFVQLQPMVI